MATTILKKPEETVWLTIDLTKYLSTDETVLAVVDLAPDEVTDPVLTITAAAVNADRIYVAQEDRYIEVGKAIQALYQGGLDGTLYSIRATFTTSIASNELQTVTLLQVQST